MEKQVEIHNDYLKLYKGIVNQVYKSIIGKKDYNEVEIICPFINRCDPNPLLEGNKVKIICIRKYGISFFILNDYYGKRLVEDSEKDNEFYIIRKKRTEYTRKQICIRPYKIQFYYKNEVSTYIDTLVYYRKEFNIESLKSNYPEYEFYIENIEGGN